MRFIILGYFPQHHLSCGQVLVVDWLLHCQLLVLHGMYIFQYTIIISKAEDDFSNEQLCLEIGDLMFPKATLKMP